MSLFKSIVDFLLGNKTPKQEVVVKQHDPYAHFRIEEEKRLAKAEMEIKDWLTNKIKEVKEINFTWDSGNDEAFVYFESTPENEENDYDELGEYLIVKLDIPDAGEFEMKGEGKLYIQDNSLMANYKSVTKLLEDYNEYTDEEVWSEGEHEEHTKVLFFV